MPNQFKIQEGEDENNGDPMAFEPDTELWELMERAVVALESMAAGMHDQQNSFGKVIEAALESLDKWAEYKAEVHRLEAERLEFYMKVLTAVKDNIWWIFGVGFFVLAMVDASRVCIR